MDGVEREEPPGRGGRGTGAVSDRQGAQVADRHQIHAEVGREWPPSEKEGVA